MNGSNKKSSFRWMALSGVTLLLLALAPQVALRILDGQSWSRSYFSFNPDEAPYLAYVNALKEGRARKSDPYSGRDDRADAPQPESIFSIQFVPAYAIALPARLLGISAQRAFAVLSCLVALCAAAVIHSLIRLITNDDRVAAAGSLAVLCCGSLRYAPFITRFVPNGRAQYFPFLRSYLPSFAFPFFILFIIVVWKILMTSESRKKVFLSVAAAGIFLLLLFSYFYLWTAAIAWLCILTILWIVFRPDGYRNNLKAMAVMGGVAIVGLLGYWRLLSHRAAATDAFQVLTTTHRPDLLRASELIGLVVAAAIVLFARRGLVSLRECRTLFVLSLSLLPFVVFNQQVLTGYSIQPIHYELYVANYVALLALVLAFSVIVQVSRPLRFPSRALTVAAICAIGWGVVDVTYAIRARAQLNRIRDEVRPPALRLRDIAATSPVTVDQGSAVVLVTNIVQADTLPADAPQSVLWAPHMRSFPGVSRTEEKSRYYALLYYVGTDVKSFESLLRQTTIAPSVVFGWERVNPRLASSPNPISEEEIQREIRSYSDYITSFNRDRAAGIRLSFVVASRNDNLANLDRWYARDEGVDVGKLVLYRVTLR